MPSQNARSDGSTILLADGHPVFGDLAEAYLASRGYRVRRARDGRRALAVLAEQPVLAVVADLDLEGVDGLELSATAAQLAPNAPVILVTRDAGAAAWDAPTLEKLRVAAVVQRPCMLGVLADAIERATRRRAPRPSTVSAA